MYKLPFELKRNKNLDQLLAQIYYKNDFNRSNFNFNIELVDYTYQNETLKITLSINQNLYIIEIDLKNNNN